MRRGMTRARWGGVATVTDPEVPSTYCQWGAAPRPLIADEAKHSSWFGSSIVVLAMFGWMVLILGLGALVARNDPNIEVPLEVGLGVIVTPADGWYSAADHWDAGEGGVTLQSSGVFVGFWAEKSPLTNEEYLAATLDQLGREYGQFRPLPAAPVYVTADVPGLMVHFSLVSADLGREEDELVVATHGGIAVTMWVRAQPGQLPWVQGDLDEMLYSLVIP